MEAFHKLKVYCPYNILKIEDIKVLCKPNVHGYLYLKCLIDDSINFKYSIEASTEDKISLYEELDDAEKSIIFTGIIENVKTRNENGIYYLELEAASSSSILDKEERTRSFQDSEMSYDELISKVLKNYKDISLGFTQCMDRPMSIGKPLFQYKETDYEFLKRIASILGLELICDITKYGNAFYFGRPLGEKYELEDNASYKVCKDLERYHKAVTRGFDVDFHDTDFFYYEIENRTKMDIGDQIYFKQKDLYVNQFEAKLYKGELIYKYKFCRKKGIWQDKIYNEKIRGRSLEGEILEITGEKLKLHLYIDESQEPSKAAWFYYAPLSGNILYSMPIVGESATLYFQDEVDSDPIVTGCVRKNGSICEQMSNTANRYFATETGNYLDMIPGAINFHRSGLNVNFIDGGGITFSSSGNLSISGSSVSLIGGSIAINATSQIKVQKGKSSYISAENEFYTQTSTVYENGSARESYVAFTDDEPTAGVAQAKKKLEQQIKFAEFKEQQLIKAMDGSKANTKKDDLSEFWEELKKSNPPSNKVHSLDTKEEGYDFGRIERDDGMGMKDSTFYGKAEGPSMTIGGREVKLNQDLISSEIQNVNEKKEIGLSLGQFETGINKLEFDNGWEIDSVKGEGQAMLGKKGINLGLKVALVEVATPKVKIGIPFTNYNLEVGLKGDLGSLGAELKIGSGLSFGVHAGVGEEVSLDIKSK